VPLGFAGLRHDDDLGLVDMRGRVYDPTLRRFLTPDPHVTDPLWGQSYNRYSYVVNDPVNLVDPSGFDGSDPSDPNEPDYPQGCGGAFSCTTWSSGGTVVDLPGQESGGGGSSVLQFPSGGPVIAAARRPISIPVGPTAPATSIAGPRRSAWQAPQSPDFARQLFFDIARQIAYNNALWEATAPIREQVAYWYGKNLSTPAKDQMWWDIVGGKGPPPIGFGYWGPRNWAGAGEMQGAEIVNYGLGAASMVGMATRAAGAAVVGMRVGEAAAGALDATGTAAAGAADVAGAEASQHVLLGMRAYGTEALAEQLGATHFLDRVDWMDAVMEAVNNPSTKITVNLSGFEGDSVLSQVLGAAQRGMGPAARATEWEMAQLYQSGRLSTVNFVDSSGTMIENPF
jgi:RHS repeat-associated protein